MYWNLFVYLSQSQAKLFIEQKKIPFPVDNHNTNAELGKVLLIFNILVDMYVSCCNAAITPVHLHASIFLQL